MSLKLYSPEEFSKQTSGSQDFMKRLAELFVNALEKDLEVLSNHAKNKDYAAIKASLHKMKSGLVILGSKQLHSQCKELEILAAEEQLLCIELIPELLSNFRKLANELQVDFNL